MQTDGQGGGRRACAALPLLAAALAAVGCRWVALPWVLWGPEPTRTVPAEYPYLEGKRLCVAVWADTNTQFEFPYVQLEVSEYVAAALKAHVNKVSFVPNREVVRLQQREPDWDREPPAVLGERFGAERVLLIELTQYTTREPDSPHLLRGRIAGQVKLYDTAHPDARPLYRTFVEVAFPKGGPAPWGTTETAVRRAAMEAFAAEVAGKFYDRKVKVR